MDMISFQFIKAADGSFSQNTSMVNLQDIKEIVPYLNNARIKATDMSKVGEKIKVLRMESGITQLQLGDYAGCSGQVISNIERGYTNPSAECIKKDIGILPCSFRLFIRKIKIPMACIGSGYDNAIYRNSRFRSAHSGRYLNGDIRRCG